MQLRTRLNWQLLRECAFAVLCCADACQCTEECGNCTFEAAGRWVRSREGRLNALVVWRIIDAMLPQADMSQLHMGAGQAHGMEQPTIDVNHPHMYSHAEQRYQVSGAYVPGQPLCCTDC